MKKSKWLDCQGNEFFPKQKGNPSLVKMEHKNTGTLDSARSKKKSKVAVLQLSSTPKEMWDSFKSLTSYQDLDGGNVLPLLDRDNNPVFEYDQKSEILQETFFSGNHLSENDFDEKFKEEIETELSEIRQKQEDQIYDDAFLNSEISLGETIAVLQYLKEGKAAGPDKIFTDLLLHANEELEKSIHKLFTLVFPIKRNSRGEHPAVLKLPPPALKLPPPAHIFILI